MNRARRAIDIVAAHVVASVVVPFAMHEQGEASYRHSDGTDGGPESHGQAQPRRSENRPKARTSSQRGTVHRSKLARDSSPDLVFVVVLVLFQICRRQVFVCVRGVFVCVSFCVSVCDYVCVCLRVRVVFTSRTVPIDVCAVPSEMSALPIQPVFKRGRRFPRPCATAVTIIIFDRYQQTIPKKG